MKICCLGSGYFSVAISKVLSKNEKNEISIWTHDTSWQEKCNKKDKLLLDKKEISKENITIINNLEDLVNCNVIIILVSSKYIMETINNLKKIITKKQTVLIGTKGLISMKPYNITNYAKKVLKTDKIGYIAGPNLAIDLLNDAPCRICIASTDKKTTILGKHLFNELIPETSYNTLSLEIGSVLKNIYAIGSGIIYGKYPNPSTLYSFTTSSYLEYQKILTKYCKYNEKKPIAALIADFMMTTNHEESRNFKFGIALSNSQKEAKDFLKKNTVEGYENIDFLREFINDNISSYPILYAIYNIIYKNQSQDILLDICKKSY